MNDGRSAIYDNIFTNYGILFCIVCQVHCTCILKLVSHFPHPLFIDSNFRLPPILFKVFFIFSPFSFLTALPRSSSVYTRWSLRYTRKPSASWSRQYRKKIGNYFPTGATVIEIHFRSRWSLREDLKETFLLRSPNTQHSRRDFHPESSVFLVYWLTVDFFAFFFFLVCFQISNIFSKIVFDSKVIYMSYSTEKKWWKFEK